LIYSVTEIFLLRLRARGEFLARQDAQGIFMICDWCGKNAGAKEVFHKLEDYVNTPVICDDCYGKLKNTKLSK